MRSLLNVQRVRLARPHSSAPRGARIKGGRVHVRAAPRECPRDAGSLRQASPGSPGAARAGAAGAAGARRRAPRSARLDSQETRAGARGGLLGVARRAGAPAITAGVFQ